MTKPNKFCVFCGQKPSEKNREHVIPKWLLSLTGDPNREAFLGINMKDTKPSLRQYSFNSFVFPACNACNSEFAALESAVQPTVVNFLQDKAVSSSDIDIFLDWLDKVRIGLWLGYYYLDNNAARIIRSSTLNRGLNRETGSLLFIE